MIRRHFLYPFACLALLTSLLFTPALWAAESAPRQLLVSGEGEIWLAPDMAVLQLTVSREATTAREALDANSAAMQQVLDAMRKSGVADRDLRTSQFNIQPRYHYPSREQDGGQAQPTIVGYQVINSLEVRVRDIDRVGGILDQAVSLGVNQDGQIQFTNADPREAVTAARVAAVQDALGKARTLAEAAGLKLGEVLEISEQSGSPAPMPATLKREMVMSAADAVPVATGENAYRVVVSLRIALAS